MFKYTNLLTLFAAVALFNTLVDAHMSMKSPLPRGHPLNPNSPVKDFACIMAPLTAGPACGAKPFPCGYQRDTQITQTLRAGQVIDVEFFNQNFPDGPKPGDESRDQARHSGGLCEFSLSVDDGKSFHVIASYTRGCPDIFFKFPVKIPDNIPSSDSAIFAWSWINASGNREFYMNCADVKLIGVPGGTLTGKDITKANLPGVPGFERTLTPAADVNPLSNLKGPGPTEEEKNKNSGGGGNDDEVVVPQPSPTTSRRAAVSSPPRFITTSRNVEASATPKPRSRRPPSPSVAPQPGGGSFQHANGVLAQQEEAAKDSNVVGQACDSEVCLGSQSFGLCDNGKIVFGGNCANGLQCFHAPLVNKPGTTVTCMSAAEFALRLEIALNS